MSQSATQENTPREQETNQEDADTTNNAVEEQTADSKEGTPRTEQSAQEENAQLELTQQKEDDSEKKEKIDEKDDEEKYEEEGGQEEGENGPEPINIDLSTLNKSLYQFRNRPTLPYLLTEYGMEDKDAPLLKTKQKEKRKKKKSFGDDSLRDKEKEKQQEERHLQIVKDMKKLRDHYYDEYSTLLNNKVEEQRNKIRQHDQAMKNKLSEQEEKERKDSHHVKRRVERHEFVSDDSFLHDIPKTDLYHIVQLQDKLIREGTLKTQSDLANFWERIQQPDIFYMYFKVPKSDAPQAQGSDTNDNASSIMASTFKSSQSNLNNAATVKDSGPRALSRIAESRESSRPGTRLGQHWAITQQFPALHRQPRERRRSSFTGLHKGHHQLQQKSSYLHELERRFPKLEVPKLHCFTMSLGPKPPDPEEVRHHVRLRELEKSRKKYTYKLNKMHQLAMANAAATSRILEMHEDMDFIINGSPLTDLISDHHFYSGIPPRDHAEDVNLGPSSSSPLPPDARHSQSEPMACVKELPSAIHSPSTSAQSTPATKSKTKGKSKSAKKSKPPKTPIIPLSLDEVEDRGQVVEAKCMSTLWTNYKRDELPTVKI